MALQYVLLQQTGVNPIRGVSFIPERVFCIDHTTYSLSPTAKEPTMCYLEAAIVLFQVTATGNHNDSSHQYYKWRRPILKCTGSERCLQYQSMYPRYCKYLNRIDIHL